MRTVAEDKASVEEHTGIDADNSATKVTSIFKSEDVTDLGVKETVEEALKYKENFGGIQKAIIAKYDEDKDLSAGDVSLLKGFILNETINKSV